MNVRRDLQTNKTAARGARDLLPLVKFPTPAWSDFLEDRAAAWIEARQGAGLSADASGCLQPALGHDGGWAVTRMSVNDLTRWLRGFLRDELVSTRSFKPTLLAWAARHGGIPRGTRRLLGYHVKPKDRTASIHSRDELAAPMRLVADMLVDISSGAFAPDATRSGTWRTSLAAPSPTPSSRTSSSSSSSSSSDELLEKEPEVKGQVGGDIEIGYVFNERSGLVHLDSEDGNIACGKPHPRHMRFCTAWSAEARAKCSRCFA